MGTAGQFIVVSSNERRYIVLKTQFRTQVVQVYEYLIFQGLTSHIVLANLSPQLCTYCHVYIWGVTITRGLHWLIGFIAIIHSTRNYK
jgi:hypothetical protein